jgi:hypothetical protein
MESHFSSWVVGGGLYVTDQVNVTNNFSWLEVRGFGR